MVTHQHKIRSVKVKDISLVPPAYNSWTNPLRGQKIFTFEEIIVQGGKVVCRKLFTEVLFIILDKKK